jgi:hypothetical protein
MDKKTFKDISRATRAAKRFALSFGNEFFAIMQNCDQFESFLYHYAGLNLDIPQKVRDLVCDNALTVRV